MVTLYPTTLMAGLWIVFKTNGLQQNQLYQYSFVLGLLVAFSNYAFNMEGGFLYPLSDLVDSRRHMWVDDGIFIHY